MIPVTADRKGLKGEGAKKEGRVAVQSASCVKRVLLEKNDPSDRKGEVDVLCCQCAGPHVDGGTLS